MEKHFCDVCGNMINETGKTISLSLARRYSPNNYVTIEEMCDDCAATLTVEIDKVVKKIKRKEVEE